MDTFEEGLREAWANINCSNWTKCRDYGQPCKGHAALLEMINAYATAQADPRGMLEEIARSREYASRRLRASVGVE